MQSLQEVFLSALSPALREPWEQYANLATDLEAIAREAKERWPGLLIDPKIFLSYLAERVPIEHAPDRTIFRHASDLYLTCAIASGDRKALDAFEREYMAGVASAVGRFHLSSDEIDEVKQLLRQQFLMAEPGRSAKIVDYSGLGELLAWLRVAAVRAAIKLKKQRPDHLSEEEELANMPGLEPNAELEYVTAEHRAIFRDSLRQAIASLETQEQNVLRQHYLDGLTFDQLAALYRVHRTTTAYWVERARDRLLKRTRQALMNRTRMSVSDCDSVFRQAQSQFAITFQSLFR